MGWVPRSGLESIEDVVWLPRLLQKARRREEGRAAGTDLMNGYMYGDNDFIDEKVLRFLHIGDTAVSALVREQPDDSVVARSIVESSGTTPDERRQFSRRLRRQLFDFVMLEADEGRIPAGFKRSFVQFVYRRLIAPAAYAIFRRAEEKRAT